MDPRVAFTAPGAAVAGILLGDARGAAPATSLLVAAGVGVAAIALSRSPRLRTALFLLALVGAGCALEQRALDGLVSGSVVDAARARDEVTVVATLLEDPAGSRWSARALAAVESVRIHRSATHGVEHVTERRTVLLDADGSAVVRLGVLAAGDRAVLRGWLRPLEGYDERLRWRHAAARLDVLEVVVVTPSNGVLATVANSARDVVLEGTDLLPVDERALVAGFLLGDTRDLDPMVLEQFRAAGLSHLLAVSGANVAFVLALLGPFLRRSPRTLRVALTLGALVVFGAMTRWEPSVLRACAMAACAVLAVHVGRPATGIRVLALAVTVLLLVDPFLLRSVGFQLSCGASAGITLLTVPFARRLRGPAWLRESLATTAAAQVGVAPVLLPVFGSLPLVSLPANLLAVPLAGPLTMWGLTAGAVAGLLRTVAPPIAALLQVPTRLLAEGVLGIAALSSNTPLAIDTRGAVAIVALSVAVIVLVAVLRRRRRMLRERAVVVPTR
jgi:competence protein ComEC